MLNASSPISWVRQRFPISPEAAGGVPFPKTRCGQAQAHGRQVAEDGVPNDVQVIVEDGAWGRITKSGTVEESQAGRAYRPGRRTEGADMRALNEARRNQGRWPDASPQDGIMR